MLRMSSAILVAMRHVPSSTPWLFGILRGQVLLHEFARFCEFGVGAHIRRSGAGLQRGRRLGLVRDGPVDVGNLVLVQKVVPKTVN